MDHKGRQRRLQNLLATHGLDALLLTHPANVRYLCGFTGSAGAVVISESKSVFFTDGRYKEQASLEVQGSRIVVTRKSPLAAAAEWLMRNAKKLGLKALGIEAEHLTVAERSRLVKAMPSSLRLREAPVLVEQARMIKDAEEIERLRTAVLLGSRLFDVVLKAIRPGVKETEVAAELEYAARQAGADAMSFDTIIASGTRSALPHGRASGSVIPANGFVVCDFGVILAGYCSDMTRTVHVGQPNAEMRRIYAAVRDAQQAALEMVSAGVSTGEVDQSARKVLRNKGLAKHFTHSTGHGVGLEIHEAPRLAAGQKDALQAGMVITIEPGAYIPGVGGVRIEDMVLVTDNGCQILTPTGKELITI
ncbi:MAG TPA: Xaa-Pro peptidase family protein [Terriglobales bacterium]|jgi:Xaa-Pro aminopeptidase|nr:Xaa-Pro peptidase family protein [Terriglobales bacterium]